MNIHAPQHWPRSSVRMMLAAACFALVTCPLPSAHAGAVCGDGVCEPPFESPVSCPDDCFCGNGICSAPGETLLSCPLDCAVCGDGTCTVPPEDSAACPEDCAVCGDDVCSVPAEDSSNCPQDCLVCGDGVCAGPLETPITCPDDCNCGDGVCSSPETVDSCPSDCIVCGDGLCSEPIESTRSCPEDCAACGDGVCSDPFEDLNNCAEDCLVCGDGVCAAPLETPITCAVDCVCGDGLCSLPIENVETCPLDCAVCSDGICSAPAEDLTNCPTDCAVCGDALCTEPLEDQLSCPQDCLDCGDGVCDAPFETPSNCAEDCACGDGFCSPPAETLISCPSDCAVCGDDDCTAPVENADNCPADCAEVCGDGSCDSPLEDEFSCPVDCLVCGDGTCTPPFENSATCFADCGIPGCGNSVLEPGEECDGVDDDACPGQCLPDCTCSDFPDLCADAAEIVLGLTPFTTIGASTDGLADPLCENDGTNQIGQDIWFNHIATETGALRITACEELGGSADFDTRIAVYDGCNCQAADIIDCNDDDPVNPCGTGAGGFHSTIDVPVVQGACYEIRVGGFGSGEGSGELVVEMLDNDSCIAADVLTDGLTPFSTVGASTDGFADPLCENEGTDQIGQDIWYDYTATVDGTALFSTCEQLGGSADFDTRIAAYDGCDCDPADIFGCNDDDPDFPCGTGAGGFHSTLEVPITSGNCYKIRVGGFGTGFGSGTLLVQSEAGPGCTEFTACADLDDDGLTDDNCAFYSCDAGNCTATARQFADIGGPNGACGIDGTADGNDRFHALNCFSNRTTLGTPGYPCESLTPTATNVDAGGPFGQCCPDGVCDGNDAFHTLNAFSNTNPCSCPANFQCPCPAPTDPPESPVLCPVGPQPDGPDTPVGGAVVIDEAHVTLEAATPRIAAGDTVEVNVWLDSPLADLRGYQLHVDAVGGTRGQLTIIDAAIEDRKDRVFAGLGDWQAFNIPSGQLLAGLDADGIAVPGGTYMATLTFQASKDAAGTFLVELLHDNTDPTERTFLFPTRPGEHIAIAIATPAVVHVSSKRKPRLR